MSTENMAEEAVAETKQVIKSKVIKLKAFGYEQLLGRAG
jgi:hypothetical protein